MTMKKTIVAISSISDECDGKGYIDYEGTLYDLELGLALHEALSRGYIPIHQGQKIYKINLKIGTTYQHSAELLEWYRENKNK